MTIFHLLAGLPSSSAHNRFVKNRTTQNYADSYYGGMNYNNSYLTLLLLHLSRGQWQLQKAVQMDRTSAMNSAIPLTLELTLLLVLWMEQNAVMAHATMSYRTILPTAGVSLQCLSSVVKVWLCLWLPEIYWGRAILLYQETLVSTYVWGSTIQWSDVVFRVCFHPFVIHLLPQVA